MSDRTYMRTYIYGCPPDQRAAARAVVRETIDEAMAASPDLWLDEPYAEEQVPCGYSAEVARELAEAAPGASFVLWEDPAYESLGELHARTPELGEFSEECDASGDVCLSRSSVLEILSAAGDLAAARTALDRAMGGPWMDDWHAASNRLAAEAKAATDTKPAN